MAAVEDYPGGWTGGVLFEDVAFHHVVIQLGRDRGAAGVELVTQLGPTGYRGTVRADPLAAAEPGEVLRLPRELAYALHRMLARHFGDGPPGEHARADLLHERGRVDRLIEHLVNPPRVVRS